MKHREPHKITHMCGACISVGILEHVCRCVFDYTCIYLGTCPRQGIDLCFGSRFFFFFFRSLYFWKTQIPNMYASKRICPRDESHILQRRYGMAANSLSQTSARRSPMCAQQPILNSAPRQFNRVSKQRRVRICFCFWCVFSCRGFFYFLLSIIAELRVCVCRIFVLRTGIASNIWSVFGRSCCMWFALPFWYSQPITDTK